MLYCNALFSPDAPPTTTTGAETMDVISKARAEGLTLSRPMSAKELRQQNPELAARWAGFIDANRADLVAAIAGKV